MLEICQEQDSEPGSLFGKNRGSFCHRSIHIYCTVEMGTGRTFSARYGPLSYQSARPVGFKNLFGLFRSVRPAGRENLGPARPAGGPARAAGSTLMPTNASARAQRVH